MSINPNRNYAVVDTEAVDEGLRQYMLKIYNYMSMGLALSGLMALLIKATSIGALFYVYREGFIAGVTPLGGIVQFAPLALLIYMMFGMRHATARKVHFVYWSFAFCFGVGLPMILQPYTDASVTKVFFITSAAFASLSFYGYTTKRSLTGIGSFCVMALWGLIIGSVVNMFMQSARFEYVISFLGVLVFSGLIAYDTQKLKNMYLEGLGTEAEEKAAIWGAFSLYLDFINLFMFLLRLLGQRR